ncbi:hypothetical protein V6N13_149464 [Hibiscus sabdariffa]
MVVWTETDVSLVSRRQRRVCFVYIDDCAQLCYGPSLSFSQLSWLLRPFWEMFQSGVLFSDRQFFSIGGGAEWRVDFLCFGNILGSLNCDLNCGLILGRSLIVFYWNFLLFDAHGWHHFIYGMIAWVNLPLSDKYGWLDSVYGRMDLINGLVSLFDGLLLNMYECCNQIFSYVLLVFDQTLLSDLFWFSILTPFAKPAMSDILKMMANLHFTEKEIEEIDTLHFEDEHQVGLLERLLLRMVIMGRVQEWGGTKGRSYKPCYGRKDIEGSLAIKKARSEMVVNANVADDGPEDTPPQKAIVSVDVDAQPHREP